MRWQWLLGLGVTSLASGGCLISESVQVPPTVSEIMGPSIVSRDSKEPFSVDTQHTQIEWGTITGVCPANIAAQDRSSLGQPTSLSKTFAVNTATLGPVCLWARVTGDGGAQTLVWKDVLVENLAPTAQIATLTPFVAASSQFELYAPLRFTASGSEDPDKDGLAAFAWTITTAQGTTLPATPCPAPGDSKDLCFTPTTSGTFTIGLVVTDVLGKPSTPNTLDIAVAPDRAPCLRDIEQATAGTNTLLRRWDEDVAFAVAVDDDGDPFPARENHPSNVAFTWYFRKLGAGSKPPFVELTEHSQPSFRLERQKFAQGDEVQVRVEVTDRRAVRVECDEEEDDCETAPASKCTQRLTWTVRYWL